MLPSLHAVLATSSPVTTPNPHSNNDGQTSTSPHATTTPAAAAVVAAPQIDTSTNTIQTGNDQDMDISLDPAYDPSLMSPVALSTSAHHQSEISMVEKLQDVGVTFQPQLSAQRQHWAMDVLRKEHVTSVLEIGCGTGELLRALCQPASTIPENLIEEQRSEDETATTTTTTSTSNNHRHVHQSRKRVGRSSSVRSNSRSRSRPRYGHRRRSSNSEDEDKERNGDGVVVDEPTTRPKKLCELFLNRVAGLDIDPAVIPKAVAATAPPPSSSSLSSLESSEGDTSTPIGDDSMQIDGPSRAYIPPRWQRLEVEIWQGGLERHNHRLEGFEAIVATEVIEHLDPMSMDIFPQMVFGTLRPRLVLITTPNFEFNAKFPRAAEHEHDHPIMKKGFPDPSRRTDRVFRHSDHKFEMTEKEFANWCDGAEEWGYSCEISGVGISSQPSYHDNDRSRPLYATQTAVFRLESNPTRSPRSIRTAALPFMPGGGEALHPHRLAARHIHEPRGVGAAVRRGLCRPQQPADIRRLVLEVMERWRVGEVSIQELWGLEDITWVCAGSKRILINALGGWGNVPGVVNDELEVFWPEEMGTLSVRRRHFLPAQSLAKSGDDMEMSSPPLEW